MISYALIQDLKLLWWVRSGAARQLLTCHDAADCPTRLHGLYLNDICFVQYIMLVVNQFNAAIESVTVLHDYFSKWNVTICTEHAYCLCQSCSLWHTKEIKHNLTASFNKSNVIYWGNELLTLKNVYYMWMN